MKVRTVKPNKHLFWPVPLRYTSRIEYLVYFNQSVIYDLQSIEQHNWNKLCGLNFAPLRTRAEMAMVGWRWYQGQLQLAPYYHIKSLGYDTIIPQTWVYVPCHRDRGLYVFDPVRVKVQNTGVSYRISIGDQIFTQPHAHQRSCGWELPTWFGGDMAAPQEIKIYLG